MIINGQPWSIYFVSPWHPMLRESNGIYTLGVCDDNLKAIYISLDLPRMKLQKVLCHEIVHAAMFSYHIDLSLEQEEIVADLIATFGKEILEHASQIFEDVT